MTNPAAAALIARSNRLGADPKNTNYAGGNTSAKGTETDPVTGEPVELLWVKGSGGDLGTLTESGLAVLRLDRMRALVDVYPGIDREDEMVAAFDYCLHGKGGAAPSIDTAMHGLVDAAHVDHLHPDSGIAIATAADGEAADQGDLRRQGRLGAVAPARDSSSVSTSPRSRTPNPQAIGCVLGGHGITAWGDTSEEAEAHSLMIIDTAADYIAENSKAEPFGPPLEGYAALPADERRAKAAALAPTIRGIASAGPADGRPLHRHRRGAGLPRRTPSTRGSPRSAPPAPTTSCAPRSSRSCSTCRRRASVEESLARLQELAVTYREDYQAYYDRHATPDSPAIRGKDPLIVLVPGVGMFSFGKDKQTARVAGEFYVNAINVMRGAEGLSTYAPIDESEKFRIEYWALEEAKLQRMPKPKPLATRVAFVTGAASGIGKATAHKLAAEGACVVIADLSVEKAQEAAAELGGPDVAVGVQVDVSDEAAVQAAVDAAVLAFGGVDLVVNNAGLSLSRSLMETTEKDWDLQHDVMAKGSFLVAKATAKVMIEQQMGGDIVYISSKNSIFAGPNNVAYGAAKADQAHQVRLLAAELGEHGIKVNGVNPDGVVQGSGIFASGWGANRAAVYGVEEQDLGKFYAQRTILKREVLPEHIANAVFVLCGPEMTHTTGLHVPVDAGVAAAFLR